MFEKGPFSNRCLKIRSIFKQILKKYPWRRLRRRPQGAAAPWGGGFFQNMFENGPYFQTSVWKWTYFQTFVWKWTIFGSSFFQTRHWASVSNFHHLIGDASYHWRWVLGACPFASWVSRGMGGVSIGWQGPVDSQRAPRNCSPRRHGLHHTKGCLIYIWQIWIHIYIWYHKWSP